MTGKKTGPNRQQKAGRYKKGTTLKRVFPLKLLICKVELLTEVTLEQSGEGLSVARLILSHFIKTCASLGFAQGLLDQVNSLKPLKFLHLSSVFDTSFEQLWYIYHSSFLHHSKVIYHFNYHSGGI